MIVEDLNKHSSRTSLMKTTTATA